LNGQLCQKGHTADMIFSVNRIIAFVSSYYTLKIGDLIFTGTPEGVGTVKAGDEISATLEGKKLLMVKVR